MNQNDKTSCTWSFNIYIYLFSINHDVQSRKRLSGSASSAFLGFCILKPSPIQATQGQPYVASRHHHLIPEHRSAIATGRCENETKDFRDVNIYHKPLVFAIVFLLWHEQQQRMTCYTKL